MIGAPALAHREFWCDKLGEPGDDPGPQAMIDAGLRWICQAQDHSASSDGGVARHYSLLKGWGSSYPETTGYIVPTVLQHAALRSDSELRERARRMLDWEVSVQLDNGAVQGSTRGAEIIVPVVFDTGQVLQGLAAGVREFGETYRPAMRAAARWLLDHQDADGAWRVANPYAMPGDHTWDTHVAWGLLEAARVEPDAGYGEAGLKHIRWAMTHQHSDGWFDHCCLSDPTKPLTHTIGYVLRGVVEGYRFSREPAMLDSALKMARRLAQCVENDGRLSGRLNRQWQRVVPWDCLTGSSQIAICMFLLHAETGDETLRQTALALNHFVRRTVHFTGESEIVGGVKGAWPVHGEYGEFQFLNWACKFSIDASALELGLKL